eukprot:7131634-Prymnesium_polylepis.1
MRTSKGGGPRPAGAARGAAQSRGVPRRSNMSRALTRAKLFAFVITSNAPILDPYAVESQLRCERDALKS